MELDARLNPSALGGADRSQPERPFKCLECNYAFRRAEHLTRHTRSHRTEHHLKCSYCRKGFYRLDALNRHEKVHSELNCSLLRKGARACLPCAASRRKCSGEAPCSACERRSLDCAYPKTDTSRRGSRSSTPKETSNGSGTENVPVSPRGSNMPWSNATQPPVAADRGPDLTHRPAASDQSIAVEAEHTLGRRNYAENRNNGQSTQDDPLFNNLSSPELRQLHMVEYLSTVDISPLSSENQSIFNSNKSPFPNSPNRQKMTIFRPPNIQNEHHEGSQATELSYQGGFSPINWLPSAWTPFFPMDDGDEHLESSDHGCNHILADASCVCGQGRGTKRRKFDAKRPHDGHFFGERRFEELETTSCYGSDSKVSTDTLLPMDDDASDVAGMSSVGAHGEGLTEGLTRSRANVAMTASPTIPSLLLELNVPAFMEFSGKRSRRALVDHFCNVFSHRIAFSEDLGNPFRQLILPLAHKASAVMNAIYALSSAHLENRGVNTEEKSSYFYNEATRTLAKLINHKETSSKEDILGAILLLIYYEALVQRDSSNMVIGHLKGAMIVMKSYPQSSSPTSMFLQRMFQYYDVITAFSFGTTPISSTSTPLLPLNDLGLTCPVAYNDVDSLLGMTTNFWHIIHRLAHLCELKSELQEAEACSNTLKITVLRTELECASHAIEHALTQWKYPQWPSQQPTSAPPSTIETFDSPLSTTASSSQLLYPASLDSFDFEYDSPTPLNYTINSDLSNPNAHVLSIVNSAEAYRQAALVFLYRNIHLLARSHPKVQMHCHLTLAACERVVGWAGPMPALLWPLFIGSVEALSEEDRGISTRAFSGTERRQGMLNITRAWEIVQEVWRRGNEGEEVDWRDICKEKGVSLIFG